MKCIPIVVASLILLCSPLAAQTFNFNAIADSTIYSNLVNNNGGGHAFSIAGVANNGMERFSCLNLIQLGTRA